MSDTGTKATEKYLSDTEKQYIQAVLDDAPEGDIEYLRQLIEEYRSKRVESLLHPRQPETAISRAMWKTCQLNPGRGKDYRITSRFTRLEGQRVKYAVGLHTWDMDVEAKIVANAEKIRRITWAYGYEFNVVIHETRSGQKTTHVSHVIIAVKEGS